MRRLLVALSLAVCGLAASAAPSPAIVGGQNASPGEYPSVALVRYGAFQCTGTLIAPDTVLTAGHCSSVDAGVIGTPVTWPAALVDVRIGGHRYGEGERRSVSRIVAHQNYLATSGYDISLLKLSTPSAQAPTQVAGASETGLWSPGTMETIAGWGVTEEGGDTPDILQEAQVPIVSDPDCAKAYDSFENQTQVCAGFPEGGVDTCQGDSGGPMFGRTSGGTLRVVGATSYGEGCARPNRPGVYARVGDSTLREWIRGHAPNGVAATTTTTGKGGKNRTR